MHTRTASIILNLKRNINDSQECPWILNLIKNEEDSVVFWLEKCLILIISPFLLLSKKCANYFRRETGIENKQFKETKPYWTRKSFYEYCVNRTLPFLQGGLLEITLLIPLNHTNNLHKLLKTIHLNEVFLISLDTFYLIKRFILMIDSSLSTGCPKNMN